PPSPATRAASRRASFGGRADRVRLPAAVRAPRRGGRV
ncbi:MAG: hypothetical protein AVDCRST_MAG18-5281, partial [uncultured Thermomicrobiales bacterium]